ncbi:TPA: hypothetical protein JIR17_02795 [Acinetobacter baumannii]|uniref:hypothetical protein n=2 Tax=Acinetobacter baumannii TaxID=470 RepID=UPI000819A2F6|nr:hypothetical protein [Acinetobacter baumannii]SCD16574.1 Uncharacterised protein [Acinetobacter baumannii]HAW7015063.1 hypothetical protein [Acinetobacter baumannii]HAW7023002.1 hypothetical protein [Acinetobacter baumannii]HAW7032381.1 hypothetical protein [Acinetobacter baumannii]HAW7036446.1 hypothetical protein [Acinetobacter baumannii]
MIKHAQRIVLFNIFSLLLLNSPSYALSQPTVQNLSPNRYIFVENNVDHEYFIVGTTLLPHFTGANVWTKHKEDQDNLGHMGTDAALTTNSNVDMWLSNGTIKYPFQGVRCRVASGGPCPAVGYMVPEYTDEFGFYKSKVTSGESGGAYSYASFAPNAYSYLNSVSLNGTDIFDLNVCSTREEYNPQQGGRCRDAKTGTWRSYRQTATKIGHIRLNDTKAFSEIWIASDGTPSLAKNNEYCEYVMGALGTANQREGIACKMLSYNLQGNTSNFHSGFYIRLKTDNTALKFTPSTYDLQMQTANGSWVNYNAANPVKNMMVSGEGYITVLFSKAFFQKLLNYGSSPNGDGTFIFEFDNRSVYPYSGLYGFSVTNKTEMIPREYSISIKPTDSSQSHLEGKIGQNKPNLEFNYTVTQSAPRKADVVTAQVIGEKTTVNGQTYCLFKSDDSSTNVAIPAYLAFTDATMGNIEKYSGCDESQKLDITNALWTATPWDVNNSGYFYSTSLSLIFPMNNSVSERTIEGNDWMGSVHAEGDIKVDAKWIGVNN